MMEIRNQLFIDGQWCDAHGGATIPIVNPATREELTQVQKAGPDDLLKAVAAAKKAFHEAWGPMNPFDRSKLLHKVGETIESNSEFLSGLESDDVGKPMFESQNVDVASAAATFHYFADVCVEVNGARHTSPFNEVLDYTIREPLGVVGAIIPWNFPFLIAARKIATALAAGNTMVIKPASWAPLSTLMFGELFQQAGMPQGVLNITPAAGRDAGRVFAESPDVEEVTFTGSTSVGRGLYAGCAAGLKDVTLELGGKSPGLVLPDCDMDETIAGTLFGVYLNQGECCCGLTRAIVHEDVYDEFVERFTAGAEAIKVGPPRDPDTRMGPLVHDDHLKTVIAYIESGRREGATIACGGDVLTEGDMGKGNYLAPTVFTEVSPEMTIWREEIFGPVVTITKAGSTEEMVALANDTEYGLAASIWTQNLRAAHALAPKIAAGTIWFNLHNFVFPSAPYGGFKASGVGSELGREGMLAMTRIKNVMVSMFPEGFRWY